jgi:hypothetical protein
VSRCVSWDLSGNEFSNCHSSVNTWTDRVTAHSRVSISPYGDVVLIVYTEKSSYWIGNPYVFGRFWVRDHGLDVESSGTRIYFIDRETGTARELHVPIYDVRSMALSEDGRHAMLEKRNFFSSSTNTPDETFSSSFSTCNADYRRLNLDVAPITTSPIYSTALVRNKADCYDGATFAP